MFSKFILFSKMLPPHTQFVQPCRCTHAVILQCFSSPTCTEAANGPAFICYPTTSQYSVPCLNMSCSISSGHTFKRKAPFAITSFIKGGGVIFDGGPIFAFLVQAYSDDFVKA